MSTKSLRLTRPEPTEAQVLSAVLKYLRFHPMVAWSQRMNTGAYVVGTGKSRRYVRYGFPGCSDVIGQFKDGRFLAIEVKRQSGRATEAQAAFLSLVARHGGVAAIVRSTRDLEALLAAAAKR